MVNLSKPVSTYSTQSFFQRRAATLWSSLEQNELTVVLEPAPRPQHTGHMIRVAVSQNPPWYQSFFHEDRRNRRDYTEESLERIVDAEDNPSDRFPFATYDRRVRRLVYDTLIDGYQSVQGSVPPDNTFREEVGLEPVQHGYLSDPSDAYTVGRESRDEKIVEAPF